MYELLSPQAILGMFDKALEEVSVPEWVALIAFLNGDSMGYQEIYRWLDQNPSFREWVGGRKAIQLGTNSVTVINREYECSMQFHKREMRKDQTGQIRTRIDNLVQATAGRHWQQLLTPLLYNGAASVATYGASATYDGANFFSASHRGSQDNRVTISGFSARVTTVQADEGILQAVEKIMGFTDEHGEPANEGASGFVVIAPPNVVGSCAAALRLEFLQGTSGAIQNTLGAVGEAMGFNWTLANNTRLLSQSGWGTGATRKIVVCRSDNPIKPFIRQEALGVVTSAKIDGSDFTHDTNSHEYGVNTERGVGYGLWEHAVEVTFAA